MTTCISKQEFLFHLHDYIPLMVRNCQAHRHRLQLIDSDFWNLSIIVRAKLNVNNRLFTLHGHLATSLHCENQRELTTTVLGELTD